MTPAVIILAAGASSRMGHPKALTMLDDETALARIVRLAKGARIIAVLGEHHDLVRAAHPGLAVEWVHNRAPDAGRTGSLQCGLEHARADRVLVWPVDHPLARADTIAPRGAGSDPADPTARGPTIGGKGISSDPDSRCLLSALALVSREVLSTLESVLG